MNELIFQISQLISQKPEVMEALFDHYHITDPINERTTIEAVQYFGKPFAADLYSAIADNVGAKSSFVGADNSLGITNSSTAYSSATPQRGAQIKNILGTVGGVLTQLFAPQPAYTPPPQKDNTMMIVVIGVGLVLVLGIVAVMVSKK